jgi:hypothetical protein
LRPVRRKALRAFFIPAEDGGFAAMVNFGAEDASFPMAAIPLSKASFRFAGGERALVSPLTHERCRPCEGGSLSARLPP